MSNSPAQLIPDCLYPHSPREADVQRTLRVPQIGAPVDVELEYHRYHDARLAREARIAQSRYVLDRNKSGQAHCAERLRIWRSRRHEITALIADFARSVERLGVKLWGAA